MWLDSKTTVDSAGSAAAAVVGVPYVERDVFLDNVDSVVAILEQLARLKSAARDRGFAVGIGHPHDATIDALRQWLDLHRKSGELPSHLSRHTFALHRTDAAQI